MTNSEYLFNFLDTVDLKYRVIDNLVCLSYDGLDLKIAVLTGEPARYLEDGIVYSLIDLCILLFDRLKFKESNIDIVTNILNTLGLVYKFKYSRKINMINSFNGFRIYVKKDYTFLDMDTDIVYTGLHELMNIFIGGR